MMPFHETAPTGPTATLAAAMQAMIPVIKTERLVLCAPQIEDFDTFTKAVTSERSMYYGDYDDGEGAWADFVQLTGTWSLRGHGAWTVADRATADVLGFVHIGAEPGDRESELGYVVTEVAEGNAIAFEAAAAVRALGFGAFALPSLVSYIDAKNTRSVTLAKRLGATRDAIAEAEFLVDDRPRVFRHALTTGERS